LKKVERLLNTQSLQKEYHWALNLYENVHQVH